MESANLSGAVEQWTSDLGPEKVITREEDLARFCANVSGFTRTIPCVLRPVSTREVQQVVEVARGTGVPVYPVSCGKNWGLGSSLPVTDGCAVVDLSGMSRIHEVSIPHHYAVVEPGVTQGQLYQHLRDQKAPLILNVTGAGRATSLIGNALERGIGYFASRAESLCGLEVVLGSGEVVELGSGRFPNSTMRYLYRYGAGPFLDGLFPQSNFGIVTRAAVDLLPAPEHHEAFLVKVDKEEALASFIDGLGDLRRADLIRTVIHVGNKARSEISLGPMLAASLKRTRGLKDEEAMKLALATLTQERFGAWSAVAGIMGNYDHVQISKREIKRRLQGTGTVTFISDASLARIRSLTGTLSFLPVMRRKRLILDAMEPLFGLTKGIPTDEPLKSVTWPVEGLTENDDPDQGRSGMLYCLPFLPVDGRLARHAVDQIKQACEQDGFKPYITLNLVDARCLEAVVSIAFDRHDPAVSQKAHHCIRPLHGLMAECGYIPYRVGLDFMDQVVNSGDTFGKISKSMKALFDPQSIIAPGRYVPE